MARRVNGEFGVKVKKVVMLVSANKDAPEVSEKVKKGLNEYTAAETEKGEAMKEFAGVQNRWEGTLGLNKKAMMALHKISKMSDAQKADFFGTFLPGLEALLPDQLDLFASADGGEDSKTPSEAKTPAPDGANAPLQ